MTEQAEGRRRRPAAPKAVLFDLDGTLLDHGGAARTALRQWLPTVGVEASPSIMKQWFDAEDLYVGRWRAGFMSWQEQRRSRLRGVVSGLARADDVDLDAAFERYLQQYEMAWRSFDDVAPALGDLDAAGLRVGVLTDGSTVQQHAKLGVLGLASAFEFVLTAEDLGVGKPHPSTYLSSCARFELAADEVVHVGDVPELDLEGPRAAGLHALLIDRVNRYEEPGSLRSLLDLPARIDSLRGGSAPG